MASLTIRDIPEGILARIRALSERDRRSMNKEFIVIVEDGLQAHCRAAEGDNGRAIPPDVQTALWRDLAGKWEDDRSTKGIVADIRQSRTAGREVSL